MLSVAGGGLLRDASKKSGILIKMKKSSISTATEKAARALAQCNHPVWRKESTKLYKL